MKKPNITPGEWRSKRIETSFLTDRWDRFSHIIEADGFTPACTFTDGSENAGTAEANARAIAALPQCLAALARALSLLDSLAHRIHGRAVDERNHCRAALIAAGFSEGGQVV